jgi:nonsense-mediated mRNA decay protein 3
MAEGEFCVVCGRTDVPLEEGLCVDCYARAHSLVSAKRHAVVELCPTCGARKVGQHWERRGSSSLLNADDLTPFLQPLPEVGIRRVRWEETGENPLVRQADADVDLRFRGTERHAHVAFEVKIRHQTCPECSRRSGHYFTAILQLRGPDERLKGNPRPMRLRLAEEWDRIVPEARPEWREALSWREERPEGWDIYLTDTIAARAFAKLVKDRLGAKVKESPTLYGRKDGRDLYRVTFSIRVPQAVLDRPVAAAPPPTRRGARTARVER